MSWDEIVGKLLIAGLSRDDVGDMTLRNVFQAISALNDNMKYQARLAGAKIEDDEDVQDVDAWNAGWLENVINASVRGGL